MNGKHLFLTSAGLTDKMKEKFFDIIGKCPKDVKVLYIPTAGIETDGARESLAICFHELFLMGIQYENILVYNLELILSKDYQRTYSSYVTTPFMLTRLLTFEELNQFDAVFVSGGDVSVLCREMSRTGFDIKAFESTAKKYGIDFALKKDSTETPPRYLVFFKGRDADALTAAFKEFSAKKLTQEQKPSIRKLIVSLKEKAAALNAQREKVKNKDRGIAR